MTNRAGPVTDLQQVLIDLVQDGLAEKAVPQTWLAWKTGYSTKHINTMLRGHVEGSLEAWDALLKAVGRWPT